MHRKIPSLTRRRFVNAMAAVPVAAALPRQAYASPETDDVMAKLTAYMSEASNRPLPEAVVADTKHHILDTLAAMISGSELTLGQHALKFAREFGGQGIATIVASPLL